MNPRVYRFQLGILFGILCLNPFAWTPAALAQNAVTIEDKDKASNSVGSDKIEQYVQSYIPALSGENADARTQAREALIAGAICKITGSDASAGYLDNYADVLAKALRPLTANPSMIVRLNVAIVTAKVAQAADNTRLIGVVQALLGDKAEGVQLWALRAARYVLPAELRVPGASKTDKLIPAIAALAKQNISGTITNEAYNALALDYLNTKRFSGLPTAVQTEMFSAVVPPMHVILRSRIAAYASGSVNEPTAERDVVNMLVNRRVWESQDAKQKTATLQTLLDLLTTAAGAAQAAQGKNIELIQTVRDAAKALSVPFLSTPTSPLSRVLVQIAESPNMKPWEQVPTVTAELIKIDKGVKPTSVSMTASSSTAPSKASPATASSGTASSGTPAGAASSGK